MRVFLLAALTASLAISSAATAGASPVLRVKDGVAKRGHDRLLPPRAQTALPRTGDRGRRLTVAPRARAASLTTAERDRYRKALAAAQRTRDGLYGTRRAELSYVISAAQSLDGRGQLTSSRLNAVVMTLDRNREFWATNDAPAVGTRLTFYGSPVILEYYAGRGLQIQPLGNFGKINAAWSACRSRGDTTCTVMRTHLDAMIALASQRGSFTAWEYFFDFEGGVPPWISSMSQGTGIQALSRAYNLTGDARYRSVATAALGAFETALPLGVAKGHVDGTHYHMYSYAPDLYIFNGFFQSLVGLDDYRDYTGDTRGTTLFRAGHGNAKYLTPLSDTGSWSLYSLNGSESTRNYHELLTDILGNLCRRIGTTVYCDTATRFRQYLAARPA